MKFIVSSNQLHNHLQAISRVIASKNTLAILDDFLFTLKDNHLQITASDLESTAITRLQLENAAENGSIAIPAKILLDTLKEFPEQPLNFDINPSTLTVEIRSSNGKFSIAGQDSADFPVLPSLKPEQKQAITLPAEALFSGISKTLFAVGDDELRPIMNGIFVEIEPEAVTFVSSDSHKLVRYRRTDIRSGITGSFVLPKKPAGLLKNILPKTDQATVLEFDEKNAFVTLSDYQLISRLIEGTYPNYHAVIPPNNPNKLFIDRLELYNSLRRVSVFSNQASNLIKLQLTGNQLTVSAQDLDFSVSAYETLPCSFEGDDMEIGFKAYFLIEILSNLTSQDVIFELGDPSHACLVLPATHDSENEDILMLIMPMMLG